MESLSDARATLKEDDFSFDEDIRHIFIDEAVEVLQTMDTFLPQWIDDPNDFESLKEVRRGFHTLKGSGRMVGANTVGEVAWAIENLLNRVLLDVVPVSDDLLKLVSETKYIIPFLINDFANQEPPSSDPALIILKAENLRMQREVYAGTEDTDAAVEPEATSAPQIPPPVKIVSRDGVDATEEVAEASPVTQSDQVAEASETADDVNSTSSPAHIPEIIDSSLAPDLTTNNVEQTQVTDNDTPAIMTEVQYPKETQKSTSDTTKQAESDINKNYSDIDKKIIFFSIALAIIIMLCVVVLL